MNRQNAISFFKAIAYAGIYGGLLMPLVFIPFVIFPFVFSKLIAFQILVGITFPAYAALAWMEPKYRPPKATLYFAILSYFVALGLSVIFSTDIMRSWWGNQERMNGLFTLLHFLAWLTMAVGVLKTWVDWKRLLNYQIVLSVVMAGVSLLQLVKKDLLLFPAGDRIGGLLDNPIYMGSYQMFNLAFLGLLFLKTKSMQVRAWYTVAAVAQIAAFALTQSRGALVGLAALIGSFALYYAFFTGNKKARWGILAAAGALFATYGMLFLARGTQFITQNGILNRLTNFSFASETRFIAWDIAWKGFLERPLTGWGLDAFHILFNLKYNPKSLEFGPYETWFDRAHNTVMDVLSMTGLIGFITFVAIFATLFISVWQARKKNWIDLPTAAVLTALPIGYFLQNLFVFDHPAAFSMSYLLFALVIAACQPGFQHEPHAPAHVPTPRPVPWTIFAVLQVLLLLVVWRYSVLPFQASLLVIRANNTRPASIPAAWELMKQAGTLPTPYTDEQAFMLSRDVIAYAIDGSLLRMPMGMEMYAHAKALSEQYITEHPRNTHAHYIYARLLNEVLVRLPQDQAQIDAALAEREYKAAIETSPERQQLYHSFARLYSMIGKKQEASGLLKIALDFNQNVGESWWYVGLTTWYDLGHPQEGMEAIMKAVTAKAPYNITQAQEATYVAEAAATLGRTDVLQKLLTQLPGLGGGSVDIYLNIARWYEKAGMTKERNDILNALEQADPGLKAKLQALRDGTVDTIDASIAAAPAAAPAPTPTPEPAPSAPATSGTGPRR